MFRPVLRVPRSAARAVLLPLLLAAFALAPAADAGRRRLDAPPDPGAPGPWAVGRTSFSVADASRDDRTLAVDVTYPVDPEDATGGPSIYDMVFAQMPSPLALDAPEVSSAAAFPMIVFSHGNGGVRFQSLFLTEGLASHGFVVVSLDHSGNTAFDLIFQPAPPFTVTDRPRDVSFVIDEMLARNADPTSAFFGRIDPERIGVTGHSFGGFTTIAMGAGFAGVPPDPRVDALVPLAPVSTSFSTQELGSITQPTLILGGTLDDTTPLDPQSTTAFEEIGGRPIFRVDIDRADHFSFSSICVLGDALIAAGAPAVVVEEVLGSLSTTCTDLTIDIDEAHRIINHYTISFMKVFVEGDPSYVQLLSLGRAKTQPVTFFRNLKD